MRDPSRIDRVLATVREVWEAHPQLRLAQLINACSLFNNAYYMEDEVVERELKALLEKTRGTKHG